MNKKSFLWALLTIFVIAGGVANHFYTPIKQFHEKISSWPVVEVLVTRNTIIKTADSKFEYWEVQTESHYYWEGKRQKSHYNTSFPLRIVKETEEPPQKFTQFVLNHPVGSKSMAWVSPDAPDIAIIELDRDLETIIKNVFIVICALGCLVAIILACEYLPKKEKSKSPSVKTKKIKGKVMNRGVK